MLRFPVKKIRKQFKLLLLLVLLTFAVWFTYLHINQGKAIKLHFNYGKGMMHFKLPFMCEVVFLSEVVSEVMFHRVWLL